MPYAHSAGLKTDKTTVAAAEKHMDDTQKLIVMAEGMITHYENREKYHDGEVLKLQKQIDDLNAEKAKEKKILDDYDKKDEDD
ncbi:MAG: hypothetical protein OXI67_20715 [Candidatus Poribacteria bacterium]|nr:hypothetical protein [Candidatus Poribacteria bacterium]